MTWLARKTSTPAMCAEYGCRRPPLDDNCRCRQCRDAHRYRIKQSKNARRKQLAFCLLSIRR